MNILLLIKNMPMIDVVYASKNIYAKSVDLIPEAFIISSQ